MYLFAGSNMFLDIIDVSCAMFDNKWLDNTDMLAMYLFFGEGGVILLIWSISVKNWSMTCNCEHVYV
jgi:hypothetical protein